MKKLSILIAILTLTTFSFGSLAPQNGYDQFQKALAKERGEGNLEEAIALYQKVIEESKDESLSAKAQFRIGICYEKLGREEAQKAFQKVIDNYPAQIETVKEAREKVNGISITTDMIFGFPGEKEEDFQASLRVMENIQFDFAFLYRYSEREGTKACHLPGSVPEETRINRLKKAIAMQNTIAHQNNEKRIGSETVVLIEALSKDGRGWFGFSDTNIPVVFTSESKDIKIGAFVNVLIGSTTGSSLIGKTK